MDRMHHTTNTNIDQYTIALDIPERVSKHARIINLDTVDSTNNYAKSLPPKGPSYIIIAEEQSEGRGRFGRAFASPKGRGVYMSYSFCPKFPMEDTAKVTSVTAVLVHRMLARISGKALGIKWVNDIYRDGLKICGILTEGVGMIDENFERIVIGVGINVIESNLSEELDGVVGALADEGDELSICEIASALATDLYDTFEHATSLDDRETLDYYREHCIVIGEDVAVHEINREPYIAKVLGINDNYELIVEHDGVTKTLSSGEVSIKRR